MPDSFPIINYGANNISNNDDDDEVFSGKLPTWQLAGILKTIIAGKWNRYRVGDRPKLGKLRPLEKCINFPFIIA